jgi:mannitol/fructose-specific phosphotransferase system IIA component (Ntr-type)
LKLNLDRFTESRLLLPRLTSEWRDSAISELSQRLESAQRIENATAFTHAVLDRESLSVFDDVAFPLARARTVRELSFTVGLSPQGVRWGIGRTALVHVVILLAVPWNEGQRYLSLLLTMFNFLHNEVAFSALRRCSQPEEMLTVLSRVRCLRTGPGGAIAPR